MRGSDLRPFGIFMLIVQTLNNFFQRNRKRLLTHHAKRILTISNVYFYWIDLQITFLVTADKIGELLQIISYSM